ncbi:MAG TPA: hypothetical protein VFK69_05255, partial [Candidatus Eisenbacteria bacterium]|nr:hypothetical protein [Candidatus Eisenbacteria bacterium]
GVRAKVARTAPSSAPRRHDTPSAKPRLDKLGVKPGARVALLGLDDREFARELATRDVVTSPRVTRDAAIVFLWVEARKDLARLAAIERAMARDAALWVLRRKGVPTLTENHVRDAALATGLVDVKVASFSDTVSAVKLVIPLARR